MQGSSRASAVAVQETFDRTLDGGVGAEETLSRGGVVGRAVGRVVDNVLGSTVDRRRLGEDLFGITGALDANIALRRAVGDPSRDGDAKAKLVERLFGGKVEDAALKVAAKAASQRWSAERDLTDTLESLAVTALVAAAEEEGRADQVEDELFRFERIVAANPPLRDALTDRRADPAGKERLVAELLQGKASDETVLLVRQAVGSPRGRRFDRVLEQYLDIASTRREQLSATVTSAVSLDDEQRRRLAAALSSFYDGKAVHLNVVVDPEVLGGIRVQIGDDVVDGTILRRLEAARRHLGA